MLKLTLTQIKSLTTYVDKNLRLNACDHTLKLTIDWADANSFDLNNLTDILEENGAFCDCEVVMNLLDEGDLVLRQDKMTMDTDNLWKLPKDFKLIDEDKQFNRIIIATEDCTKNCYADSGELLIPAPYGAKPKKRIRRSVHFFIGLSSGKPNEYGFIAETEAVTATDFAKMVKESKQDDLVGFTRKEAYFYLSRLENLNIDTPVGTHFMEKKGLTGKSKEMRIHKIFLRK